MEFLAMLSIFSRSLFLVLLVLVEAQASKAETHVSKLITSDILSIDRIPNTQELFIGGYRGFLGKVRLSEEGARFEELMAPLSIDILVIKAFSAEEAVIGTSKGDIYRLVNGKLQHVKALSEYKDPILDMAVKGNEVWAVGPRGLIAKSKDRGKTWETLIIDEVKKSVTLTSNSSTTWFLGVSNIIPETFVFSATVNGKKVEEDEDYYLDANAGNIEIVNPLDESSNLKLEFSYLPGPQFQAGDVSLNTVSYGMGTVLIAGEFGTVIILDEDGSWKSIYEDVRQEEVVMPYWIESSASDQNVVMVGAGGVATMTHNGGETWVQHNMKNDNGIFDVALSGEGGAIAAGAVGTVAILKGGEWDIADRSSLDLIAWLKAVISLGDGSHLVAGGRGSLVLYKNDTWHKLVLRSVN